MPNPPVSLIAASAETVGYWFGASLLPILLIVCIYSCVNIARRDITSSKCVNGLALVLLGMLFFMLSGFGEMIGADPGSIFFFSLMPLAGALSILVGMIVALVGLVQYPSIKPPLRQGRKQAVTALVFGALMVALAVGATLRDADLDGALEKSPFAGLGHTKPQTFEDLNFRFKAPPVGWVRLSPSTLNEEASVAYGRLSGEVFFMLIAERLGIELAMTSDELREIAEENLNDASPGARISAAEKIRHDGLDGVRFQAAATAEGTRFFYDYHVFAHNGFGYQLITFGENRNRAAVNDAGDTMISLFDCIDPERMALGEGTTIRTDYESERLGYAIDLKGEGWYTTEELQELYAEEDFVAAYRGSCWLSVIVMPLADDSVPNEAVIRSLLALKAFDYPASPITDVKESEVEGGSEIRFTYTQDVEGNLIHSLARVLRANGFAYLIQSDRYDEDTPAADIQRTALDSARLISPRPDGPTEGEQEHVARFYNRIGLHYFDAEDFEIALKWFRKACELPEPTSAFIDNACQALVSMDQLDDALAHLDRYSERYRDDLDLRGDHAWLLAETGKEGKALEEYAELFASGLRDADDLQFYADLLVRAGNPTAAIRLVKGYRAVEDGIGLIVIHADLLVSIGQPKLARKLLQTQSQPHPPQILDAFIGVYEATGEHGKVIATVNALIDEEYAYLRLYQAKARAEIATKRFEAASRTVAKGLKGFPDDPILTELGQQASQGAKK